ncbi:MAG TPA: tetratricopeptide repeat protein, partial [Burkholderiaceae bacterium]|nr:tetratricopeptide repeat protein [Burkholderiaceae bacterium]
MLMMFSSAADAMKFAMAYHRALAGLPVPLTARAGLHVGPVLLRENSADDIALGAKPLEVEGMAKPTAARVMSLARGGQTLLTPEARENLGPTELKVESLGHWMVKGVEEPIELFEAGAPGTRFIPPTDSEKVYRVVRAADWWLPVKDIPNNLPFQATSFIGRETELDEVKSYLHRVRLLTLLGMGGLGKTRLCLQVAAETMHLYPDGVWFLDLAPLRDDAHVAAEAAQAIGVKAEPDRTLLQAICAHLKSRRVLIILDNCEHLVKASAELAQAILRAAPYVRLLATSREALHVPGEQSYPVHPLPLPPRGAGIDDVSQSTAVRLFVERAQQHKPSFTLDATQAAAVAELVGRLEGIPLALELAAARVKSLPVAEINARLKDRYKILTGGARVLQERQQTLRALVDWSYDLLTQKEQTLFARLGIFVGGFDLAAAEQICGTDPLACDDILDLLASLVEKSLIMLDESDEGGRYRMLETIRDYAVERLEQHEDSTSVATRHCDHYFAMSKAARDGMQGPEQAEWIRRVETDIDNMRSAMSLALDGGVDQFIAVKMAVALQPFWRLRGYATEGRKLLRMALAKPEIAGSDLAQAWALYVAAALAESQSDHREAREMLENCLELRRRLGNPVDLAATLSTLSLVKLQTGDVAGAAECEKEALRIFRDIGHRRGELIGLIHLGQVAEHLGQDQDAKSSFEEAFVIAQEIKHQALQGECELLLGQLALAEGATTDAELWFKRSLTLCREAADRRGEANALRWLGKCDIGAGALPSARSRLRDALKAFRNLEMWDELLGCLEDLASLWQAEGRPSLSIQISAATQRAREKLGLRRAPREEARQNELLASYRASATGGSAEDAWIEGSTWKVEDAVRCALDFEADRDEVPQVEPRESDGHCPRLKRYCAIGFEVEGATNGVLDLPGRTLDPRVFRATTC